MKLSTAFFLALISVLGATAAPDANADPFPRPPALQPMVDFWTRIYAEVATDSGLIHDARHLDVVYERVVVPANLPRRTRERRVAAVKKGYAAILRKLGRGKRSGLDAESKRVLALWPEGVSNETLRGAARRLRFQRGQADKFRDGLIRSGRWREHIRATFVARGLPAELSALPHVESSYNPRAYSKVGAAGLWQFTRSTGRRYMAINSAVDERMDPFLATDAATKLFKANLATTGSWPLAITAYNHGAAGMRRAKRRLGTSDIDVIVAKYQSRTFGFASRNFYAEFLAALHVDQNAERYFGPLTYDAPERLETVTLDSFYPGASIAKAFGIEEGLLQELNPSLRPAIWSGQKRVPKGFVLRVPADLEIGPATQRLASIAKQERFNRQTRDRYHKVRRGETLSTIASRYGVSQRTLLGLNSLRSANRIRAGQRLRLPDDPADRPVARAGRGVPVEPAWEGNEYRVRRGESLDAIARRVGSTPKALAAANGIRNANRIYVGQMLKVPGAKTAAATETVAAVVTPPEASTAKVSDGNPAETPATPETVVASSNQAQPDDAPTAGNAADPQAPSPSARPEIEKATEISDAKAVEDPAAAAEPSGPSRATGEAVAALTRSNLPPSAPRLPTTGAESLLNANPARWTLDGERVTVQSDETLGHYADWLEIETQSLRRINGMRSRSELVIGRRIRLDFSQVSAEEFSSRRISHHRALRVAFLKTHAIKGTREHVLRQGETLWEISRSRYGIPLWLIRDYNPNLDFARLQAGVRLQIPDVERRAQGSGSSTDLNAPESPA